MTFFPISNTMTIMVAGYFAIKWLHTSTVEIKNISRFWSNQHAFWKDYILRLVTVGSENRTVFTVILQGKFTAVSSLLATIFKICSAILGNPISSSEINAGAPSCLVRKKVDRCVFRGLCFFVPASNKKHEQGKIHIRLLITGVFHGLFISSTFTSNQ